MSVTIRDIASTSSKASFLTGIKKYQVLLIILVSIVVFIGLGQSSLKDYDEGIYSQVAREMVLTNDWLTLRLGGMPWFEKPPLYIWATALLFKTFGASEFWARAVAALSSVAVVLLTYLIGSRVFNRRVGFLSILPLMTGYEFLRQSRNGTTDVMLTMFMMATLAVYIMSSNKRNLAWYLLAVILSLGFMVKFWAVLLVVMAIGISLLIEGKLSDILLNKHFWGAVAVALALVLPWHIAMYAMHGQAFVGRYFVYDLLARSTSSLEGNTGTARFYYDRMSYDYSPWFFLLPIALTLELKRVLDSRDRSGVLLVFAACLFGVYSLLVSTKIFHYLTPIYPVFAIFIANSIVTAYDDYRSFAFSGLVVTVLIAMLVPSQKVLGFFLLLVGLLVAVLLLVRYFASHIRHSVKTGDPERPGTMAKVGDTIYRLLVLVGSFGEKKNFPKVIVIMMCFFLAIPGVLRSRPLYKAEESPVEQIARVAGTADVLRDKTVVALALPPDYEYAIVGPAAMFYSNRPIEVAWSNEKLARFTSEGSREIIMGERFISMLEDEYDFLLLAQRPPFVYGVIRQKDE